MLYHVSCGDDTFDVQGPRDWLNLPGPELWARMANAREEAEDDM